MSGLENLKEVVENLAGSGVRITEKRKYIAEIQDQLNVDATCRKLSDAFEEGATFSWMTLFDLAKRLSEEELLASKKALQKAKDPQPSKSQQKRQSSGRASVDCFNFYRHVVSKFSDGVLYDFPAADVTTFCFRTLRDNEPEIRAAYFHGAVQIISKYVLCDSWRFCWLTPTNFNVLIVSILDALLSGDSSASDPLYPEALRVALEAGATRYDVVPVVQVCKKLREVFEDFRKFPGKRSQENLVACTNILFETYSFDHRPALCEFGDAAGAKIVNHLDFFSDQGLQKEVTKFFCLQFILHYPRRVKHADDGAISSDSFTATVKELYRKLQSDISKVKMKQAFHRVGNSYFSHNALELACRVLNVVFVSADGSSGTSTSRIDIDGDLHTDNSSSAGTTQPPRKRHCIEIGWTFILDLVKDGRGNEISKAWLKIVEYFISKFSDSLSPLDAIQIMRELISEAENTKRPDFLRQVLNVLRVAILCIKSGREWKEFEPYWINIYQLAQRMISSRSVQSEAVSLISVLLDKRKCLPKEADTDLVRAIDVVVTDVKSDCLDWIGAVLTKCEFNERLLKDDASDGFQFGFRNRLIDWILTPPRFLTDENVGESSSGSVVWGLKYCSPAHLAKIFTLLMCDVPARAPIRMRQDIAPLKENGYEKLEEMMVSQFCSNGNGVDNEMSGIGGDIGSAVRCVQPVAESLVEKLASQFSPLLVSLEIQDTISTTQFQNFINHWCLQWSCSTIFGSTFPSNSSIFLPLYALSAKFWDLISKHTDNSQDLTRIFLKGVTEVADSFVREKITIGTDFAPGRLLNFLYTIAVREFNVYGSPRKWRYRKESGFLHETIMAFGSTLTFSCLARDLTDTQIPEICCDFVAILCENPPVDLPTLITSLRQIGGFFQSDPRNENGIASVFLEVLKTLLAANGKDVVRVCELLETLEPLSAWAAVNENIKSEFFDVLLPYLKSSNNDNKDFEENSVSSAVTAAALRCFQKYLQSGADCGNCSLSLNDVLSLRCNSFRINYAIGLAASWMVKSTEDVEKIAKAYNSLLKKFDKEDRMDTSSCLTMAMCRIMARYPTYHALCLVKLVGLAAKKLLNVNQCKTFLRNIFGGELSSILHENMDTVLSYWLGRHATGFDQFPYQLWDKQTNTQFLNCHLSHVIPLATTVLNSSQLNAFWGQFDTNCPDQETSAEEMAYYSLAVVAVTSSSKQSTPLEFFNILTEGDERFTVLDCVVGTVVVISKWTVIGRPVVGGSIELDKKSWTDSIGRLVNITKTSNFTELLDKLPERSVPKLLVSLRCCALQSPCKERWLHVLDILMECLDFHRLDNRLNVLIVREVIYLASQLLADTRDVVCAKSALVIVINLCDMFHGRIGEAAAEYFHAPLAAVMALGRNVSGLETEVRETMTLLGELMMKSETTWSNCPLIPVSCPNLRSEQIGSRDRWNVKELCEMVNQMQSWMLTVDDLDYVGKRLSELTNRTPVVDSDCHHACGRLVRKLLFLISRPSYNHVDAVLKLLAKLYAFNPRSVLEAFLYEWDYSQSMENAFLTTLDECMRTEKAELVSLSAECLVNMIDLVPSMKSAIGEAHGPLACYKAFVPKKDHCLNTLGICCQVENVNATHGEPMKWLILALCRNEATICHQFLKAVEQLFLYAPFIADRLLPYVVEYAIGKDTTYADFVAQKFNEILTRLLDVPDSEQGEKFRSVIRCMLGCVRRLQLAGTKISGMESYALVKLDYIRLANAAVACGMPSAAPLLVEIGTESFREGHMELDYDFGDWYGDSLMTEMVRKEPMIGSTLLNSFVALDDGEAVEGLGEYGLHDARARVLTCELKENAADKLFLLYSSIENVDQLFPWYVIYSLKFCNINVRNRRNGSAMDNEYSCAWKLCQWDALDHSKTTAPDRTFNRLLYETLQNFSADDELQKCTEIWERLATDIRSHSVPPNFLLSRIYLTDELESAVSSAANGQIEELQWEQSDRLGDWKERAWLRHAIINRVLFSKSASQSINVPKLYTPFCCHLLSVCRRTNLHHIGLQVAKDSKKAVAKMLDNQPKAMELFLAKVELQEVELLWESSERILATSLLKTVTQRIQSSCQKNDPEQLACLSKCFLLQSEFSSSCDASTVTDKLVETAGLLQRASCNKPSPELSAALGSAHLAMAQFANRKYQQLSDYINSPFFAAKKLHIEKFRMELQNVENAVGKSSPGAGPSVEERTFVQVSKRKCAIDENEVSEVIRQQRAHLITALTSYLNVLALCDQHDVLVFRAISLWFDNLTVRETTELLQKHWSSIKTHKWLVVFPQLASRLETQDTVRENTAGAKLVREIVSKVVLDHPFHTFYILNALSTGEPRDDIEKRRQAASKQILSKALTSTSKDIFKQMKRLTGAFVSLQEWKPATKKRNCEIPSEEPILSNTFTIPLPTMSIEPSPSANYDGVPTIVNFERSARIMSGLSAPKRVTCVCSDGIQRRFLVKGGQDDPRQDAIMEQLFGILNIRLKRKERELGAYHGQYGAMRTYNVVPLSATLGLIENCDGCISLGDYLTGENLKRGARSIYFPKEPSAVSCRQRIIEVSKEGTEKRLEVFMDICKAVRPVFRHFFYERFSDPNEWYERRRAYVISLAVSCMVGHVVGLSDRHVQNIMIDEKTGEIVQIDHGMAFEQGRLLPTPETVPFRLTREITNPMGVCGLDGVFRRSCVRTLTVLRESKDILMPILSVLLHDPVSQWTLTVSKAQHKQPEKRISDAEKAALAESKNIHAERAIMRVYDKLNGRENTELLSVEAQVNHLVNVARDPKNLCVMYGGWQAYF